VPGEGVCMVVLQNWFRSPHPVAKRGERNRVGLANRVLEPADLAVSQHGPPIARHHATDEKKPH